MMAGKAKVGDAGRRNDRHQQPRVAFHLSAELLGQLQAYCQAQRIPPGYSDVCRVALEEFLSREGFRGKGGVR